MYILESREAPESVHEEGTTWQRGQKLFTSADSRFAPGQSFSSHTWLRSCSARIVAVVCRFHFVLQWKNPFHPRILCRNADRKERLITGQKIPDGDLSSGQSGAALTLTNAVTVTLMVCKITLEQFLKCESCKAEFPSQRSLRVTAHKKRMVQRSEPYVRHTSSSLVFVLTSAAAVQLVCQSFMLLWFPFASAEQFGFGTKGLTCCRLKKRHLGEVQQNKDPKVSFFFLTSPVWPTFLKENVGKDLFCWTLDLAFCAHSHWGCAFTKDSFFIFSVFSHAGVLKGSLSQMYSLPMVIQQKEYIWPNKIKGYNVPPYKLDGVRFTRWYGTNHWQNGTAPSERTMLSMAQTLQNERQAQELEMKDTPTFCFGTRSSPASLWDSELRRRLLYRRHWGTSDSGTCAPGTAAVRAWRPCAAAGASSLLWKLDPTGRDPQFCRLAGVRCPWRMFEESRPQCPGRRCYCNPSWCRQRLRSCCVGSQWALRTVRGARSCAVPVRSVLHWKISLPPTNCCAVLQKKNETM